MKKNMQGFTLIELMIVVAIIAILAAIAISQYQDYVIRTQVSEGSSLASGAKTAVTEFYNNKGRFASGTGTNASYGLAQPGSIVGKYVSQVSIDDGVIIATYGGAEAHDAISTGPDELAFSPVTNVGSMAWNCNVADTTVETKYLPTICRP